jgi:hypothetical protein
LQDDSNGQGPYIKEWNLDIPKPTMAQLDAFETQANIVESNQAQVQNRIKEYGTIAQQIEYITENGLDAWQTKVNNIKAKYPKEINEQNRSRCNRTTIRNFPNLRCKWRYHNHS